MIELWLVWNCVPRVCSPVCCFVALQGGLGAAIKSVDQAAITMLDRWRVHIKASSSSSTTNLSLERASTMLGAARGVECTKFMNNYLGERRTTACAHL